MRRSSAASHERHDLEAIARREHGRCMSRSRNDFAVPLDGDTLICEPKKSQQRGDSRAFSDAARLSIDDYVDTRRHRRGSYHLET